MLVLLTVRQHLIPYLINRMRNFISLDSSNLTIKTQNLHMFGILQRGSDKNWQSGWKSSSLVVRYFIFLSWFDDDLECLFDQKISSQQKTNFKNNRTFLTSYKTMYQKRKPSMDIAFQTPRLLYYWLGLQAKLQLLRTLWHLTFYFHCFLLTFHFT